MVPFSFENIARSASLDAPSVFPISDAARATHESFESHLQRAAASTRDQSARQSAGDNEPRELTKSTSNEPPQNQPIRQDTGETRRDAADVRETDAAEATTAARETSAERNDEEVEQDAASEVVAVVAAAAEELRAAIREPELAVSGDSDDNPDREAANKLTDAPLGDEQSELNTSLVTSAGATADDETIQSGDDAAAVREAKRVSNESAESANSETRSRLVDPSDTNEQVVAGEFDEAAQGAETKVQDDAPLQESTRQQRRGSRGGISAHQSTYETPDADTKPVAVDVVDTALETASEDGSRQPGHHQETDGPQPIRSATAADATTTTPGTPSRFAQHLLARTEDPNARGLSITHADQARFVDRVARAVQATGDGGGTLRLRLSPPELGSLSLEVKVEQGVVTARVEADTQAARSLLLENLPLLRERLAEYGMRVDQFDVDLSGRNAGGTPDGLQQNDQQHEDRPRAKTPSSEPDDTSRASSGEVQTKNGNEQLNIIV